MALFDFLKNFTKKDFREKTIDLSTYTASSAKDIVAIQAHAMFTVINLISTLMSKCEIDVYRNGDEYRKDLWDMLNNQPNRNQNAIEWKKELIVKLLYQKEVLVVQKNKDQLIIADSFSKTDRVLKDTVFSEVAVKDMTFNNSFSISDVLYCKYSNVSPDIYLDNVFAFYTKLMSTAAAKYHRSKEEKGILKVSGIAAHAPDFEETFKVLMNDYFKDYFGEGNSVLPLFDGYDYGSGTAESTKKYSNEITDVRAIFEDALIRAAQAYMVPTAIVRGDVAGIKDNYNIMLTNCIDPLADQLSRELTNKFFTREERVRGSRIKINTMYIKHCDLFDIAAGADKLISSGAASIDEIRYASGLPKLNEEWSMKHYITKNYATVDMVEGGETDGTENNNMLQDGSGEESGAEQQQS